MCIEFVIEVIEMLFFFLYNERLIGFGGGKKIIIREGEKVVFYINGGSW